MRPRMPFPGRAPHRQVPWDRAPHGTPRRLSGRVAHGERAPSAERGRRVACVLATVSDGVSDVRDGGVHQAGDASIGEGASARPALSPRPLWTTTRRLARRRRGFRKSRESRSPGSGRAPLVRRLPRSAGLAGRTPLVDGRHDSLPVWSRRGLKGLHDAAAKHRLPRLRSEREDRRLGAFHRDGRVLLGRKGRREAREQRSVVRQRESEAGRFDAMSLPEHTFVSTTELGAPSLRLDRGWPVSGPNLPGAAEARRMPEWRPEFNCALRGFDGLRE